MEQELMNAINEQADRAEKGKPGMFDLKALSWELSKRFPNDFSAEEIEEKLKEVWRSRGLSWYQS